MGFAKFLLCGFCVVGVGMLSGQAHAGFDVGGEAKTPTSPAHKVVTPNDPSAPALEVYNDRYVPDNVKKKYGLGDDWFGSQPQSILPEDAAAAKSGMIQQCASPDMVAPATSPAAQPVDATIVVPQNKNFVESWRARKGENVRDILRRWSAREHTDLMWASENVPVLAQDFSYVGKFQNAVDKLVSDASGGKEKLHLQYRSEGMEPVMMAPASTVKTNEVAPIELSNLPKSVPPVPVKMKVRADDDMGTLLPPDLPVPPAQAMNAYKPTDKTASPETRWLGLSGAPLAEVMKVWAEEADVRLIWQSEKNFALQESISKTGTFEEAIFDALSQFNNMPVRPVGEMYRDPQTGARVLVVRTAADN